MQSKQIRCRRTFWSHRDFTVTTIIKNRSVNIFLFVKLVLNILMLPHGQWLSQLHTIDTKGVVKDSSLRFSRSIQEIRHL